LRDKFEYLKYLTRFVSMTDNRLQPANIY